MDGLGVDDGTNSNYSVIIMAGGTGPADLVAAGLMFALYGA